MTELNLIRDAWIPVRHHGGRHAWRAPWDLFGAADDPVLAIASPRPDFDSGITQLLIGLLQAVMTPENAREWGRRADRPPAPAEMRDLLEPLAPAFELLGSGPRCFQDPSVAAFGGDSLSVEKLLIDLGMSEGGDLFSRNGSVGSMCLACAAAALATMQANAPSGGRGNLTSLRGGGPLTTILEPEDEKTSLWRTLWLNVLPRDLLPGNAHPPQNEEIFPWLRTPKVEPTTAPERASIDGHVLLNFFALPRRYWLGKSQEGSCGLCGRSAPVVSEVQSRPNGTRYTGAWVHPLSPYRRFKGEQLLAVKGDEKGIGFRHWLGLVVAPDGSEVQPALVVRALKSSRDRFERAGGKIRLWASGYAMDNMKASAWSEGRMPIFDIRPELAKAYAHQVGMLIEGANLAESYLRRAFKSLVARRAQDVKREPEHISARFWQDTEVDFYDLAARLLDVLSSSSEPLEVRQTWHAKLCAKAKSIFDLEVAEADFRAAEPGQVANSWNELRRSLYGKKIKGALELPIEAKKEAATKSKRGKS
jgi:CRISPR system Cascade subunit CasA